MISRCPSCGVPAPDEARQCPACNWDFVGNKKSGDPAGQPPKKTEPGASKPPSTEAPAIGLGMARLPKVELGGFTAPGGAPKENPLALPVARNLGPKPGGGLFASLPPAAKPKEAAPSSIEEPARKDAPRPSEPVAAKAPAAAAQEPSWTDGPKPARRRSTGRLAALAGGALGLFSVGAIFMMFRSEPRGAARPTGSSAFLKRSSHDATVKPVLDTVPAVSAAPPAPIDLPQANSPPPVSPVRPTATFALPARPKPATAPAGRVPAPAAQPKPAAVPAAAKKPSGPQWVFEGVVYDLLTTRGVFGARLVFVDAQDNEVASITTGEDGHYHASMKAGPPEGYALRIVHEDYGDKHIDELDATSSVRKADLEQRKFLMQSGSRSFRWIGSIGKATRRDMALVPKVSQE